MKDHKYSNDPFGYLKAEIARLEKKLDQHMNQKIKTVPVYNTNDVGFPLDSVDGQLSVAKVDDLGQLIAPIRKMGVVIPSARVPLAGGLSRFHFLTGVALRVDQTLPSGTRIHIDYGHVPPLEQLYVNLHVARGWNGSDRIDEPWERAPWNGGFGSLGGPLSNNTTFHFTASDFSFWWHRISGFSVITAHPGDTIVINHPAAIPETGNFDTAEGTITYSIYDWVDSGLSPADGIPYTGDTGFGFTHIGTAQVDMGTQIQSTRNGSDIVEVDPVLVSGDTGENSMGVVLPVDVPVGFLLLTTAAKMPATYPLFRGAWNMPNIWVNWGDEIWDASNPIPHYHYNGNWTGVPPVKLSPNR